MNGVYIKQKSYLNLVFQFLKSHEIVNFLSSDEPYSSSKYATDMLSFALNQTLNKKVQAQPCVCLHAYTFMHVQIHVH